MHVSQQLFFKEQEKATAIMSHLRLKIPIFAHVLSKLNF
jgi:hypothetical protein